MPRQLHMTYVPGRKGWMKWYKGKMYSVSCKQLGTAPSKEGSWLQANQWWEAKQAEIDAQEKAAQPSPVEQAQARVGAILGMTDPEQLKALVEKGNAAKLLLATLDSRSESGELNPYVINREMDTGMLSKAQARIAPPGPPHRAVSAHAEQWLNVLQSSVGQGLMTAGRHDAYKRHIAIFSEWFGKENSIDGINAAKVEEFWAWLSLQVAEGRWSAAYCQTVFMTARQFIARLAELSLIPMPGNIRSRRFRFNVPAPSVQVVSTDEVKQLLAGCDGFSARTKLYLLLMLNCGMYQSDISDLGQDEVDWDKGTLSRPRSKTPKGPKVTYKLWPETFALLKQFRATTEVKNPRGGDRAILTERGEPLVKYWMEKGRMRRYDVMQSAFLRLYDRLELPRKPIKLFRKTSASLLGSHPTYSQYVQYFLAHSPRGMADRHYVRPDDKQFFAALDWLRDKYQCR